MESTDNDTLIIRQLGLCDYMPVWRAMQDYTATRDALSLDEVWLLEHPPVFTQGQNGKPEHLHHPGDIPVIQVDRGGQVTYHGPGQLIAYLLIDIKRRQIAVRQLVCAIEKAVIALLSSYGIAATTRADAPGVYVGETKIASLGLRIRRGCSFHGLSFNICMDLEPFSRINPCGLTIKMSQLQDWVPAITLEEVMPKLIAHLATNLGYNHVTEKKSTYTDGIL